MLASLIEPEKFWLSGCGHSTPPPPAEDGRKASELEVLRRLADRMLGFFPIGPLGGSGFRV